MSLDDLIRAIVREEVARAIAELRATDQTLSVEQAAEVAHVVPGTIRRWISRGQLPERRAGRRVLVLRSDLERFLKEGAPDRSGTVDPEALAKLHFG